MGDGRIFLKKAATTLPLIKIYRMSLLSAGSILLDSTFKEIFFGKKNIFIYFHFAFGWEIGNFLREFLF